MTLGIGAILITTGAAHAGIKTIRQANTTSVVAIVVALAWASYEVLWTQFARLTRIRRWWVWRARVVDKSCDDRAFGLGFTINKELFI